ncbi:MAG TPA: hypothetical protein VFL42_03365 [Terriglobales bacterium]|nr:hypothetical protein [Terriglobales bacterium]
MQPHPRRQKLYTSSMEKIRIETHSFSGLLWFIGWLFTIGFVHLGFWKGALALLIWPYYLGGAVRIMLRA